ncbi:MAG: cytochrome c3 family protein, partial [Bryobacteraceae bacterium]
MSGASAAKLAAAASLVAALLLTGRQLRQRSAPPVPSADYVDSRACAGCHQQIYKSYQQTGMGRSFYVPRPGKMVEDFERRNTFHHKASGEYYQMYLKEGRYFQRRHQVGFDGRETNVLEREIHYVIGSGNHVRTYLHRTASGKIVELPVAWYADRGGFWSMNPGYDQIHHQGFRRRITHHCMFCHNAYPEVRPGRDASGSDPVFDGKVPEGIDCQRCHGPGREHLQAAQAPGAKPESVRRAILNPARLNVERQTELCMQCHLESTSFRLPHSIRRFERPAFSYRPGEPLGDYILNFDHPPGMGHDDKFEIAHQAYRLRKSACFQATQGSAKALTCTTCHNPHDIPRGEAATRHYMAVCKSCHGNLGRHAASADCLGCHMPKRRTDDVVHVVMTDHYIQRRKPNRDLLAPLPERHDTPDKAYVGRVALYYPPKISSRKDQELYVAVAQIKQGANMKDGIPLLEKAIRDHQPTQGEFYFELAEAYKSGGQTEKAVPMYRQALARKPDFWPALYNLGSILS